MRAVLASSRCGSAGRSPAVAVSRASPSVLLSSCLAPPAARMYPFLICIPTTRAFKPAASTFKLLKAVHVRFDPLGPGAVAAREFIFRSSAKKLPATNQKCKVDFEVVEDPQASAQINLTYLDGTVHTITTADKTLQAVFEELEELNELMERTKGLISEQEKAEELA